MREELSFTAGRIIVRGRLVARGKKQRADYVLSYLPNRPLAVIEAKDASYPVGGGMQQALGYAAALDVPFAFSVGTGLGPVQRELACFEAVGLVTRERRASLALFPGVPSKPRLPRAAWAHPEDGRRRR